MSKTGLENWIPYKLLPGEDGVLCNWLYINDKRFTEPFFDETILKCRQLASNVQRFKSVSTLDFLTEAAAGIDAGPPSVIIFHISRCGSTLASQLLSLNPGNIVLSEVPFFDELIQYDSKNKKQDSDFSFLKDAINLHAQKRTGSENRLIIKTDSWHVLYYEQWRKLFPQTHFILLYRDPAEVARSHNKRRGMQAVPGLLDPGIFGFDQTEIINVPLEEYIVKVLEKYLEKFIAILNKDKLAFAINYNQGAMNMVKKIASVADIKLTENDIEQVKVRSVYHAKYPEQNFIEESTEHEIPSYLAKAMELYRQVDDIRTVAYPGIL